MIINAGHIWHNGDVHYQIHRVATVTSTMDACRALAERGEPEGAIVVADEQTAGRGRVGRSWFSPLGQALYLSILLRPQLGPRQISWLTMIGALSAVQVSRDVGEQWSPSGSPTQPLNCSIKWFNDVLLNGKKLAGVLVETSLTGKHLDYAVLGIGLNVNTRFDDAPEEIRTRATSLRDAFGVVFDSEAVLHALLDVLAARYAELPASPVTDYAHLLGTLGKRVQLCVGDAIVEGEAVRVEDDGALVVTTATGERVVRYGDIA